MPRRASQVAKETSRYAAEVGDLGTRIRGMRRAINVTMVTLVRIAEGFGEALGALFKRPKSKA